MTSSQSTGAWEPEQPDAVSTRSAEADRQRERILAAAERCFKRDGFDRTSLADIGSAVGLTRGAVLYHFGSKAELLAELVEPLVVGLDTALRELETLNPPPEPVVVIDALLEVLVTTPAAADLLARDIATRRTLELGTSRTLRLTRLLAPGEDADPAGEVRAYAALGALVAPLEHLVDPSTPAVRDAIRRAALGALGNAGE